MDGERFCALVDGAAPRESRNAKVGSPKMIQRLCCLLIVGEGIDTRIARARQRR
jgi:hypothetical protein